MIFILWAVGTELYPHNHTHSSHMYHTHTHISTSHTTQTHSAHKCEYVCVLLTMDIEFRLHYVTYHQTFRYMYIIYTAGGCNEKPTWTMTDINNRKTVKGNN